MKLCFSYEGDRRTQDLEWVPRPEGRNEAGAAAEENVGEMNRANRRAERGTTYVVEWRSRARTRGRGENRWLRNGKGWAVGKGRTIDARCVVGLAALGLR